MKTFKNMPQQFKYSVLVLHKKQIILDLTMLQKLISALPLSINLAKLFFT